MSKTRIVRVRERIDSENEAVASALRAELTRDGTILVNIMSSPGSGKTSMILATIAALRDRCRIGVIEADLDGTVDADKVTAVGIPAVQIETGGFCHVDAFMTRAALAELGSTELDMILLENVGNLICTAQSQTGAQINVAILSVPEGDDKPLKYPVMFRAVDVVLLNKIDYLQIAEFDVDAVRERIRVLNPAAAVIPLSCRTGEGLDAWIAWLENAIRS